MTSQIRDPASTLSPLIRAGGGLPKDSAVLTFQPLVVARERLDGYICHLSDLAMTRIDRGLRLSFGLTDPPSP